MFKYNQIILYLQYLFVNSQYLFKISKTYSTYLMRRILRENIFESESENEQIEESRRNRSRSRSISSQLHSSRSRSSNQIEVNREINQNKRQISASDIAINIRQAFIIFFEKIGHKRGLVYTYRQRKKFQKEQRKMKKINNSHQMMNWTDQPEWEKIQQERKIKNIFQGFLQISQNKLNILKEVLLDSSNIFAKQFTNEFYRITKNIVQICLQDSVNKRIKVKELMSLIIRDKTQFKFFNFSHLNLPKANQEEKSEMIFHTLGLSIYSELNRFL